MTVFNQKIFFVLILIISVFLNSCRKEEAEEVQAEIFLVAYEGSDVEGKIFGCNDILVPVAVTLKVESNYIQATIEELLKTKDAGELKNFIKGPGLNLYQVTISDGIAEIYLKGDFVIDVPCDIQRIHEQLYATAEQFKEIKKVKIYVNDQTLESYLKIAKQGFKL